MRTLPLLLLLLPGLLAAEGLYRWQDEHGRVHFGDKPPHDQGAAEEIQLREQPLLGQDHEVQQRMERLQRLRNAEQEREQQEAERQTEADRQRREKLAPRCAQAERDIRALSRRVVYVDENGEARDVSEEQVAADRARLEKWFAENCRR